MKKNEREIKKHPGLEHPDALREFATGYHVLSNEGPLALRPCLSTSLPNVFLFISLLYQTFVQLQVLF